MTTDYILVGAPLGGTMTQGTCFGTAVAISSQTAATVAPGHDSPLLLDVGKIYFYQRN